MSDEIPAVEVPVEQPAEAVESMQPEAAPEVEVTQ